MSNPGVHLFPDEHFLSNENVDEYKFPSKPSRFYFWTWMNTVATGAPRRAELKKADEYFFFTWAKTMVSTFFQLSKLRWALFLRWASWDEHFCLVEQGRLSTFHFWGEHLSLLCLTQPQWRQCSSLYEQGGWVLFFQLSNIEEHFFQTSKLKEHCSSDKQDEVSTVFQKSTRGEHCFFRSAAQISTFF